mgnify:CR=1 FL=1
MAVKVGINGYGRIGRNVLRALYESGRNGEIEIVAINDLGDAEANAHLTQYDTAHGRFPGEVSIEGEYMVVNGDKIKVLAERNPADLPWGELDVDIVMECTGLFASKEKASAHLDSIRFITASCQNYSHGFFNAYEHMVCDKPDFILHLGDYIYDTSFGETFRKHETEDAPVTLADYRRRQRKGEIGHNIHPAGGQYCF